MPARIATGVVYATVFLVSIVWGGPLAVAAVCAILAAGAAAEFVHVVRDHRPGYARDMLAVAFCALAPLAAALWGAEALLTVALAALALIALRHTVSAGVPFKATAATLFAVIYVGLSIAHLPLIRGLEHGLALSATLLISVWANDVFAYLVGSALGRHKMAPLISPNKSWEGFWAGTIATVGVWLAAGLVTETGFDAVWRAGIGLLIALVATAGDLFESRLKREAGLKDSGSTLPGHGGFLDRVDSLVAVSLVGYYALLLGGAS